MCVGGCVGSFNLCCHFASNVDNTIIGMIQTQAQFQADVEELAFKKAESKKLIVELTSAQVEITPLAAKLDAVTMQTSSKMSNLQGANDASEEQVEQLEDRLKESQVSVATCVISTTTSLYSGAVTERERERERKTER